MTNPNTTPDSASRIALTLEYDGTAFAGWQRQSSPQLATVQSTLEGALSRVADSPVTLTCAGRTDAGVHATCQVVHFDAPVDRGRKAWTQGVNSLLPESVRVLDAMPVDEKFHARFSAGARRYHYVLYCREVASACLAGKVTHWRKALDLDAMNAASACLPGEQDFSAFRAAGCQSHSPFRNVLRARLWRQGSFVVFDIEANAFLQHMVRNIMGCLLDIGAGNHKPDWMQSLLDGKDRTQAGATAPPDGLYLVAVTYPDYGAIGCHCAPPPFLGRQLDNQPAGSVSV